MVLLKKIRKRLKLTWEVLSTGTLAFRTERQIPAITPEEIDDIKAFFPMEKFFITGHPRSGSTLLTRLIRVHPDVHCNFTAHFFTVPPKLSDIFGTKQHEVWLSNSPNRWNRGRDLTPIALRAMADFIMERDARLEGKTMVGDKSLNMRAKGKAIEEMHLLYPDAYVINMVRDGRDAVVSHLFQSFVDRIDRLPNKERQIREAYLENPEPFLSGERSVFTEKRIRNRARTWVQNVIETDRVGRELYGDKYLSLRFEDLIKMPYQTISKVWEFLGQDATGLEELVTAEMKQNPDADWQKQSNKNLASSVDKGKKGSWQKLFTERDKQIFKEIAGELLIEWGYEQDLDW